MSDHFSQPGTPRTEIYQELAQLRLIDPHTHINPHSPASTTLADLLGYHYYTELARSAGMPKVEIEDPSIGPKELVERLVGGLGPIENTVQYSWLISICRMFFGFDEEKLHLNNWEALYDRSESIMSSAQWPDMVLDQSNIEAVFLTNDFDDDLAGFDSDRYIPCLRTDDLVFHLADPAVRGRLAACTGIELDGTLASLRASLRQRFEHFVGRGARACAISLPPSFTPTLVPDGRASTALDAVLKNGLTSQANDKDALARRVFWTLAELCDEFGLPFDLMIGVNRRVYPDGVYQGQDLYDSRVSLIQYKDLFNAFPDVKFPVSVLASVTNQELVSYAWIFPNVYPNGHWWYSNTPSTITHDLAARLEAVPQTKMIGYYSDAYKLEFVWPKFDMYRKVLSGVLADQFVGDRGWSVERAVELGRQVLKDNTEEIFPRPAAPLPNDGIAADAIDADLIEVDDVELLDELPSGDDSPALSDHLGSISTAAAATAAAVGASAMGLLDGDTSEDSDNLVLEIDESADEAVIDMDAEVEADPSATVPVEMDEILGSSDSPELEGALELEEALDLELIEPASSLDEQDEASDIDQTADFEPVQPDVQVDAESELQDAPELMEDEAIDDESMEDDAGTLVSEVASLDDEALFFEESEDEEPSGTFDTILMEPEETDPAATIPLNEPFGTDSATELVTADSAGDSSGEEDLGVPLDDGSEITKLEFGDDSAGTVVEPPSESGADRLLGLSEDEQLGAFETQLVEPAPLVDVVGGEVAESVTDLVDEATDKISESVAEVTDAVEETGAIKEAGEVVFDDMVEGVADLVEDAEGDGAETLSIDQVPNDDEIGELDLDDVELIDPAGAVVPDGISLAKELAEETDDQPLDVGNLLSDDDSAFDTLDSDPQIEQLRGESSFSPDEDSLQLKPDPLTGELTFNADDGGDEIKLDPATENKTSSTEVDDDEFDLEWLSKDDD